MQDKSELIARLHRVEGQIRGISKMISEERDCSEVIRQVVAASRALDSVGFLITAHSLNECVSRSAAAGGQPEAIPGDVVKMVFAAAKIGNTEAGDE